MNVAFFLIPKSAVVWMETRTTLNRAILTLDQSGYTAVPLLDEHGSYVGTVTEGDLLRAVMRGKVLDRSALERVLLAEVPLRTSVRPVGIDAQIEELFSSALRHNFVPVTDSRNAFVGIVRRREILEFCASAFDGSP